MRTSRAWTEARAIATWASTMWELARYDGVGHRVEEVDFDLAYHRAGAAVWESGVVACSGTPGRAFEQATLLYLLSLEGEAGHVCPAGCTIGLVRALRRRASPEVRNQFLPPLLVTDYEQADRASQFLTEVQGGSDVAANACRAELQPDGTYRVWGEKWFCSVADAEQFLVTARPEGAPGGTRGLGCFLVPRLLDDAPNGFRFRSLKDKLGTRGMASAEIEFDGAVAWPIGPLAEGFKTAVGVVLNASRWVTAVGSTGMMRRALVEATGYARHRRAFGRPIGDYPRIRETLARMRVGWLGALRLTWLLTELEDRIDSENGGDADVLFSRFLVNVTKYVTSARASVICAGASRCSGAMGRSRTSACSHGCTGTRSSSSHGKAPTTCPWRRSLTTCASSPSSMWCGLGRPRFSRPRARRARLSRGRRSERSWTV